jgi:hypothetical protein
VLFRASLRGLVVRGPFAGREQTFVLARDWLGEPDPVDRDAALRELARRYLAGHGPATDRDLARWAGLPLRDVRAGLRGIGGELEERGDGLLALRGAAGALDDDVRAVPAPPPPRLLGPFEPLLLGWASREAVLGDHTGVVTVNGIFRPIALAGGRAVGTWGFPGGAVVLEPFAPLPARVERALRADAADVARFLA